METQQSGKRAIIGIAFAPDGRSVYFAPEGQIHRWTPATGNIIASTACQKRCNDLAVSRDGKWIASGSGVQILVLDPTLRKTVKELPGDGGRGSSDQRAGRVSHWRRLGTDSYNRRR